MDFPGRPTLPLIPTDESAFREHFTARARDHAEFRRANQDGIVLDAATARMYFWDGQTAEEIADMRQFLVDNGLADWVISRNR